MGKYTTFFNTNSVGYLVILKFPPKWSKRKTTEITKGEALNNENVNYPRVLHQEIFYGPPENKILPTLWISAGDSGSKRANVHVHKIKLLLDNSEDEENAYFNLCDRTELETGPVSHPKSMFTDKPDAQAFKTDSEGGFKASKKAFIAFHTPFV